MIGRVFFSLPGLNYKICPSSFFRKPAYDQWGQRPVFKRMLLELDGTYLNILACSRHLSVQQTSWKLQLNRLCSVAHTNPTLPPAAGLMQQEGCICLQPIGSTPPLWKASVTSQCKRDELWITEPVVQERAQLWCIWSFYFKHRKTKCTRGAPHVTPANFP